jgi:hypothetical protein
MRFLAVSPSTFLPSWSGRLAVRWALGPFWGRYSRKEILSQEMARRRLEVEGARRHGHPLPIFLRRKPLQRERVLLVGDAG